MVNWCVTAFAACDTNNHFLLLKVAQIRKIFWLHSWCHGQEELQGFLLEQCDCARLSHSCFRKPSPGPWSEHKSPILQSKAKIPQHLFLIIYGFFMLGRLMLAGHLNAESPIAHGTVTALANFSHFMRIWYCLPWNEAAPSTESWAVFTGLPDSDFI